MNARVIFANVSARLRTLSRERFALFFTFAFPVILILVFGIAVTTDRQLPIPLHVQDRDDTPTSRQFIDALTGHDTVNVVPVPPGADAMAHARQHELALVLIIPAGFERMHAEEQVEPAEAIVLTYVYQPGVVGLADRERFMHAMLAEVNHRLLAALPTVHNDEPTEAEPRRAFLDFFVPGIIAMAMMTASLYGSLHVNAELRQKGVLRKLAATPITATEWLLSGMLYQLVLAIGTTAAILIVSWLAFGVVLHVNAWLGLYMVLTVVAFVGMGMVITPFARDAESASAVGNAILFPMMFLSGTFFPVQLMPEALQMVAYVLPLYYINEGLRGAMLFQDHDTAALFAMVTAGFAAVLFAVGVVTSRWGEAT